MLERQEQKTNLNTEVDRRKQALLTSKCVQNCRSQKYVRYLCYYNFYFFKKGKPQRKNV